MFMMFNRLPENKNINFRKLKKMQNLIHFNEQGISCVENLVVSTFDASSRRFKRVERSRPLSIKFIGAELGIYNINV